MTDNLYDASKDEQFRRPYIDVDEWRKEPVLHHYIHGGFEGTLTRFCFYYPKKEDYTGRFFQPISPFVGDERESQFQSGAESKIASNRSPGDIFTCIYNQARVRIVVE